MPGIFENLVWKSWRKTYLPKTIIVCKVNILRCLCKSNIQWCFCLGIQFFDLRLVYAEFFFSQPRNKPKVLLSFQPSLTAVMRALWPSKLFFVLLRNSMYRHHLQCGKCKSQICLKVRYNMLQGVCQVMEVMEESENSLFPGKVREFRWKVYVFR